MKLVITPTEQFTGIINKSHFYYMSPNDGIQSAGWAAQLGIDSTFNLKVVEEEVVGLEYSLNVWHKRGDKDSGVLSSFYLKERWSFKAPRFILFFKYMTAAH